MRQYKIWLSVSAVVQQTIEVLDSITPEQVMHNGISLNLDHIGAIYVLDENMLPGKIVGKVINQTIDDSDADLEVIAVEYENKDGDSKIQLK